MNLLQKARRLAHGVSVIQEWLGDGGIAADQKTAQDRANVCIGCPHNRHGWTISAPVAKAIKRHIQTKNALQMKVKGEKQLGTCDVCECRNSLKIWIPRETLLYETSDEELKEFPPHCWIRKELSSIDL